MILSLWCAGALANFMPNYAGNIEYSIKFENCSNNWTLLPSFIVFLPPPPLFLLSTYLLYIYLSISGYIWSGILRDKIMKINWHTTYPKLYNHVFFNSLVLYFQSRQCPIFSTNNLILIYRKCELCLSSRGLHIKSIYRHIPYDPCIHPQWW